MARRLNLWTICAIVLAVLCQVLYASTVEPKVSIGELSVIEIEEQLQVGAQNTYHAAFFQCLFARAYHFHSISTALLWSRSMPTRLRRAR